MRFCMVSVFVLLSLTGFGQTFYRTYGNAGVDEGGMAIIASPDGNMFVGGYKDDSAMVMKMDLSGNIIWIRTMKPAAGGNNHVQQLEISPDGYLVGIGNSLVGGLWGDVFFFKFDMSGNLQWLNRVNDTRRIFGESIIPRTATEYMVIADVYDLSSPTSADPILIRVNATTGTVIANTPRYNYMTGNPYIDDPYAATINTAGDRIYTTGRIYVNGSPATGMRPYLSKFDVNGNHLTTSYLGWTAAQNAREYASDIIYRSDSITIGYWGDPVGASTNFSLGLMRLDTAGNIAWSKNYNIPSSGSEVYSKVLPTPTGYFLYGYTIGGTNDFFIISVSMSGNFLWGKMYGGAATAETFLNTGGTVAGIFNNQVYFTGQTGVAGSRNIVVASADMAGNIGCGTVTSFTLTPTNNPTNKTNLTLGTVATTLAFISGATVTPQPMNDVCANVSLNLGNDTTACALTLNATLPNATSYLWSTGATAPTLNVTSPGTYWATVNIGCCVYSDTIVISIGTLPTAAFSWAAVNCTNGIMFTNNSSSSNTYAWNFGDNTTGTSASPSHTYASPGTYSVTLIATNNCGSDTVVVPVTTNTPVDLVASPQTALICAGANLQLSAILNFGTGVISYNWNPGGAGSNITVSPASNSTYMVTGTDALGCSASDTVAVSVIAPVTLSVAGASTICPGGNATLTANATNGGPYTWSASPSTSASITVSPTVSTTYSVNVTDTCSGNILTDTVTVYVVPGPAAAFSHSGPDCFGNIGFQNNSINSSVYQWNFGDSTTSTLASPSHQYLAPGTYTVTLISSGVCESDTTTSVVTISNVLTFAASPVLATICPGNNLTITTIYSGGYGQPTYSWSSGQNTSSISVAPVVNTSFTVTLTDSLGCTANDTVQVNMIPAITLSASNDTTICSGSSITIGANATNGGPYTWSNLPGNTSSVMVNPTATTTYYVSVTDTCTGNVLTDSIMVTVDPLPTALFTFAGPDCANNFNFSNSSVNGNAWAWNFGDNGTSTLLSPSHQYTSAGVYSVSLIATNSCGNDTVSTNVNVATAVDVVVTPATITLCAGDSATLNAFGTGGVGSLNYVWNPNSIVGSSIVVAPAVPGWYYATVTDSLGCTHTDSAYINIGAPVTLNVAGNNTICTGSSTTLTASASNGGPYQWSNNLGTNDTVVVTPSVTTMYYVSVYDSCSGTIVTDSVIVFIMPPTSVAFSVDSMDGCVPLTVHFTDLSVTQQDQIAIWIWDFGNGDTSHAQSPVHIFTSPGSYSVTLTVITTSGCITTLVNGAVIDVYPVPVAGFSWDQTGSIGDQPEVQFTDLSTGATNWLWLFGDNTTDNSINPLHTYGQTGSFTATQIVSNTYGCADTAVMQLELTGEFVIYVPNTFTPGQGIYNNTFGGIGSGVVGYHMMIFDRWGMLIFESNDYSVQWDGRFKGNLVQQDTYVWVIAATDYMGGEHHLIGHVNVIR